MLSSRRKCDPMIASLATLRRDGLVGLSIACITLPVALSSGVLALAPLGPAYVATGAVAGLYGAIAAGAVAALIASSSFVITSPRASVAAVQASIGTHFLT